MTDLLPLTEKMQNNSTKKKASLSDAISSSFNFNLNKGSVQAATSPVATIKVKKMSSSFTSALSHNSAESPSINSQQSNNSMESSSSRSSLSRLPSRGATRAHRWQGIGQSFPSLELQIRRRGRQRALRLFTA